MCNEKCMIQVDTDQFLRFSISMDVNILSLCFTSRVPVQDKSSGERVTIQTLTDCIVYHRNYSRYLDADRVMLHNHSYRNHHWQVTLKCQHTV